MAQLYKACEVGRIVVNKCLDFGYDINAQKLQKLLVLMQVDCIRRSNKPLFPEDIRVWSCGVAIKEVDDDFKFVSFKDKQQEYITLLDQEEESVDFILLEYGMLNSFQLNDLYVNQKVMSLGVVNAEGSVPHISAGILMGVFGKLNNLKYYYDTNLLKGLR